MQQQQQQWQQMTPSADWQNRGDWQVGNTAWNAGGTGAADSWSSNQWDTGWSQGTDAAWSQGSQQAPLVANQQGMEASYGTMSNAPTQQVMVPVPQSICQVMSQENGFQLRRQRAIFEGLGLWDQNMKYIIRNLPKEGKEDGDMEYMVAAEGSTWCERNCYPQECAPFRMDIFTTPVTEGDKPKVHLEKPCQCTYLCLNRPEVFITDPSSGANLGSIRDPFACCNLTIDAKDPKGEVLFHAEGGCCQCGLCCPCPGCEVNFPVNETKTSKRVANIKKKWMLGDCCPLLSKENDNFLVEFEDVSDSSFKALVIIQALFINHRFFSGREGADAMLES